MLAVAESRKLKSTMEYMEKEYGITPENIDKKLEEIKQEFFKRIDNQNVKEVIQC